MKAEQGSPKAPAPRAPREADHSPGRCLERHGGLVVNAKGRMWRLGSRVLDLGLSAALRRGGVTASRAKHAAVPAQDEEAKASGLCLL